MAKMTKLEMVQNILSSMDSDNVNSISDTEEASQVEKILEETYYALLARRHWEFNKKTVQLDGVGDTTKPTKLQIPSNVNRIDCFRYKVTDSTEAPQWKTLRYVKPCDFIRMVQTANPADADVENTTNDEGIEMYIKNNVDPSYWTSFDDEYIYLNSWDNNITSTVTQARTSVEAQVEPAWPNTDGGTPEMPNQMFTVLLNEAKSICHLELRQQPHQKAEQTARRQYVIMREQEPRVKDNREFVNYGKPTSQSNRNDIWWKNT